MTWIGVTLLTAVLIFAMSGKSRSPSEQETKMANVCRTLIGALRVMAVATVGWGFFLATRFLLDHSQDSELWYGALTQNETALIGVPLGLLFLRCRWGTREEHGDTVEYFSLFLFTWTRPHSSSAKTLRGPREHVLIPLLLLSLLPPVLYYVAGKKEDRQTHNVRQNLEIDKRYRELWELEKTHRVERDLSQADRVALEELALSYAQLAEDSKDVLTGKSGRSFTYPKCLLGQARVLIRLGRYDQALPLLDHHRQEESTTWESLGRLHSEDAPMLVEQFILTYWKAGRKDRALELLNVYMANNNWGQLKWNDKSLRKQVYLKLLFQAERGEWKEFDETLTHCDWDLGAWPALEKKYENRDADVSDLINGLCY